MRIYAGERASALGCVQRGWLRVGLVVAAGLVATMFLSGCPARKSGMELIPLMWPEPPETPRIRFVTAFASERDLKSGLDVGKFLQDVVIGKPPPVWHLYAPMGLAVSNDKRVYVADYGQSMVYIFDLERNRVTTIGEDGGFGKPTDVAVDARGEVYVLDQPSNAVVVLDADGNLLRGMALEHVIRPTGIAIDDQRGRMYVVDSSKKDSTEHYVRVYDKQSGAFIRNIGNGRGFEEGNLYFPTFVAVDSTGNIYVSDTMNSRVVKFDPEGNFLMTFGKRGDQFGEFDKPKGVALDTFGNLYVVDSSWSNVQIFNQRGQVLLFFGGRSRYPGMLENPTGIDIDGNNTIYVADTFNRRVNVYQLVNTTAEDSFLRLPEPSEEKK